MNDRKYIRLDVHQATISVAVLDSAGKLVMEAILETKAETILQFIHGLRGSLHATFEEGTCAAWLHDLLKPHVAHVLVCDPRKNALIKVGNKSNRIDARKLADLLYLDKLHPVFHGEAGNRALKELARSYLTLTRDTTRVMNRLKALYRSWAIPCAGQRVYAPRYRSEWLAKIPPAGVHRRAENLLSAVGRIAIFARASTTRSVGGRPETQGDELAAPNPFDWTDSRRSVDRSDADAAPFSHQAATVGLLWFGIEDFHQRGIPNRGRPTETLQEISGHSRAQHQPQSRSEKYLQGCRDAGRCRARAVPGFPCRFSRTRNEANDGAPHLGAQDCRHHFDRLEERSGFRRRTSKTTSSLSVCRESVPGFPSGDGRWGSPDALVRG